MVIRRSCRAARGARPRHGAVGTSDRNCHAVPDRRPDSAPRRRGLSPVRHLTVVAGPALRLPNIGEISLADAALEVEAYLAARVGRYINDASVRRGP